MKSFLEEFYASSGSTFNVKSGRADRKGNKDAEIYGYRKCIMQVHKPNTENPRMKGLNQNCPAELNFRLEKPKGSCQDSDFETFFPLGAPIAQGLVKKDHFFEIHLKH